MLSLAKPFDQGLLKSRNMFQSGYAEDLNSGFFQQLSYFSDRDSIIPTSLYYRNYLQFGSGAFGTNPLEISLHARTVSQLVDVSCAIDFELLG